MAHPQVDPHSHADSNLATDDQLLEPHHSGGRTPRPPLDNSGSHPKSSDS